MRYCISGMPRCRTAWLTAVLRAHGSRCYHDAYAQGYDLSRDCGIVDPAVALFTPREGIAAYTGAPMFSIVADSLTERLEALELSLNVKFTDRAKEVFNDNLLTFWPHTTIVHVTDLDDNDIVGEIVKACTNKAPSSDIISTFQLLKIVEHMPKARRSLQGKSWRSTEFLKSLKAMKSGTRTARAERHTGIPTARQVISGFATDRGPSGKVTFAPLIVSTPASGTP